MVNTSGKVTTVTRPGYEGESVVVLGAARPLRVGDTTIRVNAAAEQTDGTVTLPNGRQVDVGATNVTAGVTASTPIGPNWTNEASVSVKDTLPDGRPANAALAVQEGVRYTAPTTPGGNVRGGFEAHVGATQSLTSEAASVSYGASVYARVRLDDHGATVANFTGSVEQTADLPYDTSRTEARLDASLTQRMGDTTVSVGASAQYRQDLTSGTSQTIPNANASVNRDLGNGSRVGVTVAQPLGGPEQDPTINGNFTFAF